MKLIAWLLVHLDYMAARIFDWVVDKSTPLFDAMDEAEERLYSHKK